MTQRPSSLANPYKLEGTLKGHKGAVLCLSVTDDGGILASGGDYLLDWRGCVFSGLKVYRNRWCKVVEPAQDGRNDKPQWWCRIKRSDDDPCLDQTWRRPWRSLVLRNAEWVSYLLEAIRTQNFRECSSRHNLQFRSPKVLDSVRGTALRAAG